MIGYGNQIKTNILNLDSNNIDLLSIKQFYSSKLGCQISISKNILILSGSHTQLSLQLLFNEFLHLL